MNSRFQSRLRALSLPVVFVAATFAGAHTAGANPAHCPVADQQGHIVIPANKDLGGCNLDHDDLSGVDLSGGNLAGANADHTLFIGANLASTNLTGANVDHADFTGACFYKANATGANLDHTNFTGANLSDAIVTGANLDHSNLTQANISGVNLAQANTGHSTLTGTVTNNPVACPGPLACNAPGVSSFSDSFTRADGPLGPPYLPPFAGLPAATISGDMACSDSHGTAVVQINSPATSLKVDFDWEGFTSEALETLAVAADECNNAVAYAGTDGGMHPPVMQVSSVGGTKIEAPLSVTIVAGQIYHTSATFSPNGNVALTITQGATVIGTLSGNVGPVSFHQAGAIIGRSPGAETCVDNLAISSH